MQKLVRTRAIGEKLRRTIFYFSLIDSFMMVNSTTQGELLLCSKNTETVWMPVVHNPWSHWQRITVGTTAYAVRHAWSFEQILRSTRK